MQSVNKTKILIIITTDFVPYGGLTTVMMNYYRALDKSKYVIDFASTNDNIDQELLKELHNNQSEYYCLGNRKTNLIAYISNLNKLLKEKRYDIVHINSNSATAAIELVVEKLNKIQKRIVHNHTGLCDHKIISSILYPIFKNLYTDAIAVSNRAGEWLFRDGRFTVLNNGINTEKYRFNSLYREQIRGSYNISPNVEVIGHVGKIYKPKNHSFLIDIFKAYHEKNEDSLLLLVGDGELRDSIEQKITDYRLNDFVIIVGMQRDVNKYLSAMDIFVFPSLWEGLPLSVVEAQSSGLPCVISDRIDSSVCITKNIQSISLEKSPLEWARIIDGLSPLDRSVSSEDSIELIKEVGFDSNVNCYKLEEIYNR